MDVCSFFLSHFVRFNTHDGINLVRKNKAKPRPMEEEWKKHSRSRTKFQFQFDENKKTRAMN